MFAFELTFLTGRYVATAYNDRMAGEWPPHPARVFSALVATHYTDSDPSSLEREALQWLERQGPPEICAGGAAPRDVVTVFVPVNDPTVLGAFDAPRERVESARANLDAARGELLAVMGAKASKKELEAAQKAVGRAEKELDKAEKSFREHLDKAVAVQQKSAASELKTANTLLPERRGRQARTFPSLTPEDPVVVFRWPEAQPSVEVRDSLARLSARVVRIGHSSTFVRLRVCDSAAPASWEPDDLGTHRFRVPLVGQMARLEAQFQLHRETQPRVLPALFQGYRRRLAPTGPELPRSVFEEDWLVLTLTGGLRRQLPILATAAVAEAVRGGLQRHAGAPIPQVLSGHQPDGNPSQQPHLAIVPLPAVGHRHADGHLLGVGLVLPRATSRDDRTTVYRALDAWERSARSKDEPEDCPVLRLVLGAAGEWWLRRLEGDSPLAGLRAATWCAGEKGEHTWVSVSPIALDRNPGDLTARDPRKAAAAFAEAEATIAAGCERIGLPRPQRVWATPSALVAGSEKAKRFAPFPRQSGKPQRVLVHATLRFGEPVVGPVLLGAGRYRGLGLFRPFPATIVDPEEGAEVASPTRQPSPVEGDA